MYRRTHIILKVTVERCDFTFRLSHFGSPLLLVSTHADISWQSVLPARREFLLHKPDELGRSSEGFEKNKLRGAWLQRHDYSAFFWCDGLRKNDKVIVRRRQLSIEFIEKYPVGGVAMDAQHSAPRLQKRRIVSDTEQL